MFEGWSWDDWALALFIVVALVRGAYVAGRLDGLRLSGLLHDDAGPEEQKRMLRKLKERRKAL